MLETAAPPRSGRRRQKLAPDKRRWSNADKGDVHKVVFDYVEQVERQQYDVFNRFVQLESLYDPNSPNLPDAAQLEEAIGLAIENVIASNVDTVTAAIAATDVRPRFMTDEGSWSVQRTATQLEWYAEGLGKLLDVHAKARRAFREAAKKGTGVLKVYTDAFDEVQVKHVRIDDIIVDEAECRGGAAPRQMHQRMTNVDREELKAQFPEYEEEIDRAQTGGQWTGRLWGGYRPIIDDNLVVIESWKLPIGRRGKDGYRPGRHTITVDGCDLLDEPWHDGFPFAMIVWSERVAGFYGISLAERIAGIQRAINKRNWQIDCGLDRGAVPVTYVDWADANLQIQSIDRIGTIVPVKGERPKTEIPPAVSAEVYGDLDRKHASAYAETGVSRMAASATKPAGIDSGVGLREYRDQTTQRFAPQEADYERLVLDTYVLVIACCKALGDAAPVVTRKAKFGARKIKWGDVDMGDVRVQIAAASTLSRTPAGRYQTALEWAQAGVISTDEWRRLTKHPDLDSVLSLYTQGMESVERDIEAIEDGHTVVPEPYGNLLLMKRMGQMAYLRDRDLNAPEAVLEALRQYTVLAIHMLDTMNAANQNVAATGAPPGAASDAMPTGPEMPGGQPAPALSTQAMQLKAG